MLSISRLSRQKLYNGHCNSIKVAGRITSIRSCSQAKSVMELPAPPSYPLVGNLPFMFQNGGMEGFFDLMHICTKKYGKAFRMNFFGSMGMYCFSDPNVIEEVFRKEGKFPRREYPFPLWIDYHKKKDLSDGIFVSEGEQWYKDRMSMNINLLKPKTVEAYVPDFNIVADDLMHCLNNIRDDKDEIHGIEEQLFKWSLESVSTVVFDKRLNCFKKSENNRRNIDFIYSVKETFASSAPAFIEPAFLPKIYKTKAHRTFITHMDKIYQYIEEEIKECLERNDNETKEDGKDKTVGFIPFLVYERKMEKRDLMSNIMSLMFAAVETTSTTVLWTLFQLAKNPAAQESLHDEVSKVLESHNQPTAEDLRHMPYIRAVLKELFRLHPIVPVNARRFEQETIIDGYKIPAEDMVVLCHEVACINPENFPDPLAFKPERWLRENESSKLIHPFALLPFGFGSRMCIGRRLAEQELYILLCRLIKKYRIEYNQTEDVKRVMRGISKPNIPLVFKFIER